MGDPHDSYGAWAVTSVIADRQRCVKPCSRPVPIALDRVARLLLLDDRVLMVIVLLHHQNCESRDHHRRWPLVLWL
jgi:hypothetical protein